jgi:hypothetical protein
MDEIFSVLLLSCGGGILVTATSCTIWLMLAWTQRTANTLIKGSL